jgi:hypothetical protein
MSAAHIAKAGLVIACVLTSPLAHAQDGTNQVATAPEKAVPIKAYPLRVENSMTVSIQSGASNNPEEQIKQLAETRSLLYQVAAQECSQLREIFKSDCRLVNVRVNGNVQKRAAPGAGDYISASVTSSYEVTMRAN